jgi:hypothetical protein
MVPSVIMNYINEADYAKTLVMANAKFVARVVSHQISLNPGITELYKKLMKFTTNMPEECINKFIFGFLPPKTLNNTNVMDLINNTDQTINYMVEAVTGKNAEPGELGNVVKDLIYKKIAKELLPLLPWDLVEKIVKDAKNEAIESDIAKKADELSTSAGGADTTT